MTDKLMQDTRELLYELVQYSAQNREELKVWQEKTDRQIAETNKQLSRRLGTMVEDFVVPDMPRILCQLANLPDDEEITVNVRVKRPLRGNGKGQQNGYPQRVEFDAMAENKTHVLINETKSTLRAGDIGRFVERLQQVKIYFPEFNNYQIIGAVSSFNIDPSLVTHASRQGVVVLALGDGLMSIQNKPDFQWKPF
ncbi:hypothetical protein QUF64_11735 [Anaerolineales bacterium HSG6]|nr:hypothetical protein [Anaerolineales bacterium HSG6]